MTFTQDELDTIQGALVAASVVAHDAINYTPKADDRRTLREASERYLSLAEKIAKARSN